MARYIDAEELINNLNKFAFESFNALINSLILKQPTADVQEVKYGKWLYENYERSLCGESLRSIMDSDGYFSGDFKGCNYCPNCGAKMDKVVKSSEFANKTYKRR